MGATATTAPRLNCSYEDAIFRLQTLLEDCYLKETAAILQIKRLAIPPWYCQVSEGVWYVCSEDLGEEGLVTSEPREIADAMQLFQNAGFLPELRRAAKAVWHWSQRRRRLFNYQQDLLCDMWEQGLGDCIETEVEGSLYITLRRGKKEVALFRY